MAPTFVLLFELLLVPVGCGPPVELLVMVLLPEPLLPVDTVLICFGNVSGSPDHN